MTAARLMLLCAAVAAAIGCGAPIGLESFDQHPVIASQFFDAKRATTIVSAQTTGYSYAKREANARLVFTSTTSSISIDAVNDLIAVSTAISPGGFNSLGLLVDGAEVSGGCQLGNGAGALGHLQRCTLTGWSSGSHTFEVWDGPAVILSATRRGSPAQVVYTDRGSTFSLTSPTAPAKRIVVIGDSIASGEMVTTAGHAAAYDAWPMQMRLHAAASVTGTWAGARVINDSHGGWLLHDVANDATEAAALAAQCDGTGSEIYIVALGVNDYQTAVVAATFQADVAALLDSIHTQCAAASVLVFTPVDKLSEVANGAGRTLGDYRTDETTACSARSTYCTTLSGVGTLNTGTDLASDNLHPTTAGAGKIEVKIRAQITY